MPTAADFLRAIRADPDADAVRLAYADWLEDDGDADRAEFIRVQCALAERPDDGALRKRERRLLAEHGSDSQIYYFAANALSRAGDVGAAEPLIDAALVDARTRGSLGGFRLASAFRAHAALLQGALPQAEAHARDALGGLADQPSLATWSTTALGTLTECLCERGEAVEASRLLAPLQRDGEWADNLLFVVMVFARARLDLARSEFASAADAFVACGRWFDAWGMSMVGWFPWRSGAAFALERLGEPQRARALADEELALARSNEIARAIGVALRAKALASTGGDRLSLLEEAVVSLESSGAPLEQARALTDLGGVLRRSKRRAAARPPLVRAIEIAERCGATVLARRATDELLATGARPRARPRSGVDALTFAERRVAELASRPKSTGRDGEIRNVKKRLARL